MKALMVVARMWLLVLVAVVSVACGGGGGSGVIPLPAGNAPVIFDLIITPSAAYVSATPLAFETQFSFSDPDGNLASMTLKILDGTDTMVDLQTVPIQGTEGVTAGLILGEMLANAVEPDVYTAQIFVTDATSLRSNTLSGSARISAFPWTAKLAGPTLREYAASAVLNGKLYVMGGQLTNSGTTPGPATNLVEVYDPATNTWATATPMPTARMGLVAAVMNGKIYAIGGRTDGYSTSAVGTVTEFDPATNLWVTKTATLPTARYFAAASVVDSPLGTRIFVVGGEALDARLGVVEAYEPDDTGPGNWISRTAMPTARGQLAMAQANGRLYAVGGYAGMVSQWVGTVEEYNPLLDTWATRAPMPTARAHLALAQVDGNLLAAGGENVDRALAVLERYDPLTNLWSVKTPNTTVFSRTTAGVMNGKVYMFGNGLTLEYNPANEIR